MKLAQYLHVSWFRPEKSTFGNAIKNNHFSTCAGLTKGLIDKHLPAAIASVHAHIHQERQGLQINSVLQENTDTDSFPPEPANNTKNKDVAYINIDKKNMYRLHRHTRKFT